MQIMAPRSMSAELRTRVCLWPTNREAKSHIMFRPADESLGI